MNAADPIVRVEGLVKDFWPGFGVRRKRVLHGISFCVQEGEIFGCVGPNGAGKTTTLKLLNRIKTLRCFLWIVDYTD